MMFYKTIAQKKAKADEENAPAYASPTMRILAAFVDIVVSSVVLVPLYYLLNNFLFGDLSNQELAERIILKRDPEMLMRLLTSSGIQLTLLMIFVFIYWIKSDATPGKQLLRLKIVDAVTLQPPTGKQYILRMIGYILASIPLGLGFVWMGLSKKKQGWHDLMAHTIVISVSKRRSNPQPQEIQEESV